MDMLPLEDDVDLSHLLDTVKIYLTHRGSCGAGAPAGGIFF
jgi:hypothetical protein